LVGLGCCAIDAGELDHPHAGQNATS
jgi:hypothetical protein